MTERDVRLILAGIEADVRFLRQVVTALVRAAPRAVQTAALPMVAEAAARKPLSTLGDDDRALVEMRITELAAFWTALLAPPVPP